jgi:hypothetical protein
MGRREKLELGRARKEKREGNKMRIGTADPQSSKLEREDWLYRTSSFSFLCHSLEKYAKDTVMTAPR